jgi:hypothetical protein
LSQKRKHLKLAGATPWAKINRNTRVTGATAIPFRPVVMQPTVAVALMTRSTPPQPHFEASCVASHGTPDKSGRIDLLKERYVSRDGVHGIAAAANVRYTDVPIRHQSQRPPTCTAHHCNIAPRVPPHGCPPARKCPVRCRPRQRFPAAWPPISRSFAFSSIGSGAPILRHGAQSNPREPASIFR